MLTDANGPRWSRPLDVSHDVLAQRLKLNGTGDPAPVGRIDPAFNSPKQEPDLGPGDRRRAAVDASLLLPPSFPTQAARKFRRRLNFLNNSAAGWSKANKRNKTSEVMEHKYEQTVSEGVPVRSGARGQSVWLIVTPPPRPPPPHAVKCSLSEKKPN